ncbi:thymidylate synthase [Actinokineospora spheciospongiae]|uniref:thymidylate synthase n=1 Tax=Actinokineospora spheciospongiae TaxID=909613 RepID=UPI000D71975A|nr:thymidylate synthase [Actinokineospora spheciospongiae]PWW62788.1 thymidylate synthase [Actinokineospora spheciospongiae]
MTLTFKPLHHGDRIEMVNPAGDVGLITLWSPVPVARRRLAATVPGILDPTGSRVAVVANLYGDGMYAMFCNLLFNPQVRHLVAVGEDLGQPTCREIEAFLRDGLEDTTLLGRRLKRIRGENRLFPDIAEFDADRLRRTISFRDFGRLSGEQPTPGLADHLDSLPRAPQESLPERVRVDIPEFEADAYEYRPSQPAAHHVVRRGPLDCWEELVVRGIRFGVPVVLDNGPRLELLNAKAVITEPEHESDELLGRYGFRLDRMLAYQEAILDPELPDGISYTYGNRLRGHFGDDRGGQDTLEAVVDLLRDDPESRQAYISLWDTEADLPAAGAPRPGSRPCLTTIFFRRAAGKLTLTATYRSHNLLTAWLQNVYGLMAIQRHVADRVGVPVGPVTVISHSLGIDPRSPRYELGRGIAENWRTDEDLDRARDRHALRQDPNGYFVVDVDEDEDCLVVEHRYAGLLIKQYRSDRAAVIERAIIGDMGVSLVSHAFWLGRELATKEQALRERRKSRVSSAARDGAARR